MRASATQFGRFLVVGVANTVISLVVYELLLTVGTPYPLAAPVAFAAGAVNGYIFNRRWTFRARDTTRARVLFVLVQACGALATSLLVVALVRGAGLGELAAYALTIPPVTVAAFLANRTWTFADRD